MGRAAVPEEPMIPSEPVLRTPTAEKDLRRTGIHPDELTIAELELAHAAKEKDVVVAAQAHSKIEIARAELAVTDRSRQPL